VTSSADLRSSAPSDRGATIPDSGGRPSKQPRRKAGVSSSTCRKTCQDGGRRSGPLAIQRPARRLRRPKRSGKRPTSSRRKVSADHGGNGVFAPARGTMWAVCRELNIPWSTRSWPRAWSVFAPALAVHADCSGATSSPAGSIGPTWSFAWAHMSSIIPIDGTPDQDRHKSSISTARRPRSTCYTVRLNGRRHRRALAAIAKLVRRRIAARRLWRASWTKCRPRRRREFSAEAATDRLGCSGRSRRGARSSATSARTRFGWPACISPSGGAPTRASSRTVSRMGMRSGRDRRKLAHPGTTWPRLPVDAGFMMNPRNRDRLGASRSV